MVLDLLLVFSHLLLELVQHQVDRRQDVLVLGPGHEVGHVCTLARQRGQHGVGVARELGQGAVLAAQDGQHVVGLLEGGVGAADDVAQVLTATSEPGAELVEDDRQALAVGQAQDVGHQVQINRAGGLRCRQQVLARAGPVTDRSQGRRLGGPGRPRLGRHAFHELLADQRLGADGAGGVLAEVAEPRAGDAQHHRCLLIAGDVERVDGPDLDPGDLHVLPRDDRERVVEDGPHAVGVRRAGAGRQHGDGRHADAQQE